MVDYLNRQSDSLFWMVWMIFILFLLWWKVLAAKKKPGIDRILLSVFCIDLITFFPMLYEKTGGFSFLSAPIYVLQLFAMEMDFEEFISSIRNYNTSLAFQWLSVSLYVLSPVLTGTFILSFLKDKYKKVQLSFAKFPKTYIFSELNESALSIAETIEKKGSRIIFLDAEKQENKILCEKCNANRYMLLNCSAQYALEKIQRCFWGSFIKYEASVFFINQNENKALSAMITFVEETVKTEPSVKTSVFLFSASEQAELIVDNYKAKFNQKGYQNILLRFVNSAQIISYQMLENYPLYHIDAPLLENGFNVTVIGTGTIGTHIAKDVMWCGQMQNIPLCVNIVGVGKEKKDAEHVRFAFEYRFPEFTPENYNIRYYCSEDESKQFDDLLYNELRASNYFVVATQDDDMNIAISHNIRKKYYRKFHKFPTVVAVIRHEKKFQAMRSVFAKLKIYIVGKNTDIYSMEAISDNPIYKKAYLVNCAYNQRAGYENETFSQFLNQKEAVIRSNLAYAIHIDYKLWELTGIKPSESKGNPEAIQFKFQNISAEEKDKLDIFEHICWIAFQRSEGWVSPFSNVDFENENDLRDTMGAYIRENQDNIVSGMDYEQNAKKEKLHQSMFSKQHGCIVPYKQLEMLAEVMQKDKDEFKDYDKVLNEEILNIWLAYQKEVKNV